jgi:hypothetical protein
MVPLSCRLVDFQERVNNWNYLPSQDKSCLTSWGVLSLLLFTPASPWTTVQAPVLAWAFCTTVGIHCSLLHITTRTTFELQVLKWKRVDVLTSTFRSHVRHYSKQSLTYFILILTLKSPMITSLHLPKTFATTRKLVKAKRWIKKYL